jgi:hypothetical protein
MRRVKRRKSRRIETREKAKIAMNSGEEKR